LSSAYHPQTDGPTEQSRLTKSWNNSCGALLAINKITGLTFSHWPNLPTTTHYMRLRVLLHFSPTTVFTPVSPFLSPLTLSILPWKTDVMPYGIGSLRESGDNHWSPG
jgi:hypothetical protein